MKLHVLKITKDYYFAVMSEQKKAEFRNNDRNFKVGDLIHFTNIIGDEYEATFNLFVITHILPCKEVVEDLNDYVILSIKPYRSDIDGRYCK